MLLRDYLEQTRKTQAEFANEMGVDPMTVCRWVNGYRFPRGHLQQIAEITNGKVTANDFVQGAA